ncbi:DUF262 domain-containing protein [Roseobacter sp. N2S]|uniref:DUF262 domain-containing protein n=1 Tax=Roseobacter sp. N2S TaxID=2663844 RepID=UPI0028641F10|nr:DUF262 domain-containing protein [Roseobacter sp. N2S]MDR6264909.1 hypothetical protein [Roseobacter sp. N2S]
MNFADVLNDIAQLSGRQLHAVNPQTGFIEISAVHEDTASYRISINGKKEVSRPISQLEKVWDALSRYRVVDVEVLFGGSGSSRHIPETIFANLPYVEHFKYNRKKHLYLAEEHTHELGSLQHVTTPEVRKLKIKLDKIEKFDAHAFSKDLQCALDLLGASTEELRVKFPGEFKATKVASAENQLSALLSDLQSTFFDPLGVEEKQNQPERETTDIDSAEVVGFDGGDPTDIDGQDSDITEFDDKDEMAASRMRFKPNTISNIYDRMVHKEIELQPEFQRKDRIWPVSIKSKLIESILIGLPIPALYFGERANGSWVIIDGLQRVTTIYDFMTNEFSLSGLKILDELNSTTFEALPRPLQRKIREYELHCHLITIQKDSDRMVRELFQRINTYGVKMSYQEIRCALYPGNSVTFTRYVAERQAFVDTTFGKVKPDRMRDMELILGAIAFTCLGHKNFKAKTFDTFLTNAMQEMNKLSPKIKSYSRTESDKAQEVDVNTVEILKGSAPFFSELLVRIETAFELASEVFGVDRYKKELGGRVINKSIFELVVSTFALLPREHHERLIEKSDDIKDQFYGLLAGAVDQYVDWDSDTYKDRGFEYSVSQSTGKQATINYRFKNFHALLEDVLGVELHIKGLFENDN